MNRFRKAWLALVGRLDPEVVIADGASVVTVYKVEGFGYPDWFEEDRYYETCTQAHADKPGRAVVTEKMMKIEGRLYRMPKGQGLRAVTVQPKPKREKGKRAK